MEFVFCKSNPCGFNLNYYLDIIGTLAEKSSEKLRESLWWRDLKKIGFVQDEDTCALKGRFIGKLGDGEVYGFWRSSWLWNEILSD